MKVYAVWYNWYNGEDYEDADYCGDVLKIFLNKDAATEFVTNLTADELLSFGTVPSDYERLSCNSESWIEKATVVSEPPTYYYDRNAKEYVEEKDKTLVNFHRLYRKVDDGKRHYYGPNEEWAICIREWEVEE